MFQNEKLPFYRWAPIEDVIKNENLARLLHKHICLFYPNNKTLMMPIVKRWGEKFGYHWYADKDL